MRRQRRCAIRQNQVAAYAQCGCGASNFDCLGCCGGTRHERSAGKHMLPVELCNGAVDSGSQAEVVGIHDETAHWLSLTTGAARLGQG